MGVQALPSRTVCPLEDRDAVAWTLRRRHCQRYCTTVGQAPRQRFHFGIYSYRRQNTQAERLCAGPTGPKLRIHQVRESWFKRAACPRTAQPTVVLESSLVTRRLTFALLANVCGPTHRSSVADPAPSQVTADRRGRSYGVDVSRETRCHYRSQSGRRDASILALVSTRSGSRTWNGSAIHRLKINAATQASCRPPCAFDCFT